MILMQTPSPCASNLTSLSVSYHFHSHAGLLKVPVLNSVSTRHPHLIPLHTPPPSMLLSKVIGVIIIARNGDRFSYYQDPKTYAGSSTETTALGEVSSPPTPYSGTLPLTSHDLPPRQSLSNSAPSSAPHTWIPPLPPTLVI